MTDIFLLKDRGSTESKVDNESQHLGEARSNGTLSITPIKESRKCLRQLLLQWEHQNKGPQITSEIL